MGCGKSSKSNIVVPEPTPRPVFPPEPKPENAKPVFKEIEDNVDKYRLIMKEYDKTKVPYLDKQFPLNIKSLGADIIALIDKWERPISPKVFSEVSSSTDIKPGVLGDHYFVSALAAIGIPMLKELIAYHESEPDIGAYCVKLYHGLTEHLIIIDSYFPVFENCQWAFTSSIRPDEIWPLVLEKAYAKFYGSYQNIVEGRIDSVLSAFTGGEPFLITLDETMDQGSLFDFIASVLLETSLVVTESHKDTSDEPGFVSGIIPQTGYLVAGCETFGKERLIRLRHPYGNRGVVWKGDWSTGSYKWSKEAKARLKYDQLGKSDFFMSMQDFAGEFKKLHICYFFEEEAWNTQCIKWNLAEDHHSSEYKIIVTKESRLFLSITQEKFRNTLKGYYGIRYTLTKDCGEGKVETIYSSGDYKEDVKTTQMLILDDSYAFPIALNFGITAMKVSEGEDEESYGVALKLYCTDKEFTLSDKV
eukprot:TRINITY_DN2343_c0_g1_i1.p1 TRINITY_DN2343_c0_g1~~TRINITY_DN2343_c0_g1_i1.p1  ORF type:complete len:474 (-),score=52.49 TRINITY_DN2343_c0_g1_i1:2951-4372(-)